MKRRDSVPFTASAQERTCPAIRRPPFAYDTGANRAGSRWRTFRFRFGGAIHGWC